MFYLKYRPKTIEEIDNSRVRDILEKILESKQVPHALLFIGQKGTGKTSAARIFAKAVNCLNNKFALAAEAKAKAGRSIEPCNSCENCISIARSTFTDVVEMDAASNRGIEEVKNLIRETSFLPMVGRFRVFIIDEAHMITTDGFNALLKTLEEPPKTAIFILATTNPEKLPKTIASRCVKVNFGQAKKEDILRMLKRIITREKMSFNDKMLTLIARHSENSFRDAAKILEEFSMQKIKDVEEGEKFLGVMGKNNLLEMIETKELKMTLTWIDEFAQGGGNFKNLIEELLEELRVLLLSKKGLVLDETIKTNFTTPDIVLLIKLLMDSYQLLRATPIESLPLEIAITDFYNKRKKN